jgi:hypothetical protein
VLCCVIGKEREGRDGDGTAEKRDKNGLERREDGQTVKVKQRVPSSSWVGLHRFGFGLVWIGLLPKQMGWACLDVCMDMDPRATSERVRVQAQVQVQARVQAQVQILAQIP